MAAMCFSMLPGAVPATSNIFERIASAQVDEEQVRHAMADPEIQQILHATGPASGFPRVPTLTSVYVCACKCKRKVSVRYLSVSASVSV